MSQQLNCNNVIEYDEVSSTNEMAEKMLSEEKPAEGTVIVARFQQKGRGTGSNTWESRAGENLLFSMILQPGKIKPEEQFVLNKMVSLAVMETVLSFAPGKDITIKWPNDIYAGKKKIAGILTKNIISGDAIKNSIIGIGLNVNQVHFSHELPNPVSLKMLTGKTFDLKEVLHHLCKQMEYFYNMVIQGQFHTLDKLYLENLLHYGKKAKYKAQGKYFWGKICGVSNFGHLQVKEKNIIHEFDMKEIEYLFD